MLSGTYLRKLETCNLKRLNERRFTDSNAEVVKWQTRTFEGRVAQAVRVQVPPSAPSSQLHALLRALFLRL
jgi:hypothetical protein